MDAFAVALGAGLSGRARGLRAGMRLSFHFGLFQFLMPVLGWLLGSRFADLLAPVDHWIAFGLLAWIGTRMIRDAGRDADLPGGGDPSRGWTLLLLSVATSIDALAVGVTLAMLQVRIWYPSVVIGLVTWLVSGLGHRWGDRLGRRTGETLTVAGGIMLWLVGLRILWEHLAR